jgi:hypothetical protein
MPPPPPDSGNGCLTVLSNSIVLVTFIARLLCLQLCFKIRFNVRNQHHDARHQYIYQHKPTRTPVHMFFIQVLQLTEIENDVVHLRTSLVQLFALLQLNFEVTNN